MAFLLIFTFAFINPITVSKTDAFAFAIPAMTPVMARIITGVLVSGGYVLHEVASPTLDVETSLNNISTFIYGVLDNVSKKALSVLSVDDDNTVEVPTSLYNDIINKANKLIVDTSACSLTLSFMTLKANAYPTINVPIYNNGMTSGEHLKLESGLLTYKQLDVTNCQPIFVYKGSGSSTNEWDENCIEYFFLDVFGNDYAVYEPETTSGNIYLTPDLSGYSISTSTEKVFYNSMYFYSNETENGLMFGAFNDGDFAYTSRLFYIDDSIQLNDYNIYTYLLYMEAGSVYPVIVVTNFFDRNSGAFKYQYVVRRSTPFTNSLTSCKPTSEPYTSDVIVSSDTDSIKPPITNAELSANVLTLPSELSQTIGLTSTDVNVDTATDTPGTDTGEGTGTNTGTTSLLQKIIDSIVALGDYILEGIKKIFMPDLDSIVALKEAIEEKFSIIGELKVMIDNLLDILKNDNPEPPNIIIPLSKAEGSINYGEDCIALDLSWYSRYKEAVDLFIIGFTYIFFIWRLYQRLPGIISGSDGINWSALSGNSEYSASGNIGFKPGGGKK